MTTSPAENIYRGEVHLARYKPFAGERRFISERSMPRSYGHPVWTLITDTCYLITSLHASPLVNSAWTLITDICTLITPPPRPYGELRPQISQLLQRRQHRPTQQGNTSSRIAEAMRRAELNPVDAGGIEALALGNQVVAVAGEGEAVE